MKKIEILGTGCPTCIKLEKLAEQAVTEMGIEYELEKVSEIDKILEYGVMYTPALVVDGEVKSVGKIPPMDKLKELIGE